MTAPEAEGWRSALRAERRLAREYRRAANALRAELAESQTRVRELEENVARSLTIRGRRRKRDNLSASGEKRT